MAVLTKNDIMRRVAEGNLAFTPPLDSFQLHDHVVDLRLGFTFLIPKTWRLTTKGRETMTITHFNKPGLQYFDVVELEEGQYFELLPGEYVIVATLEKVKVPNDLMGVMYPRSSTNRKGLSLDLTGIVDCGYEGALALPVRNNTGAQIVRLYPGERICQLTFELLTEPVLNPRKHKYHKKDIVEGVGKEKDAEVKLVLKGAIKTLKEKFPAK
ncbi:MAG: dCTP deaminase [Parcubacteria group bacterium Gr01-1014_72]|nr:MAG: dCTP deaminase [Parcubacteria group bacterium Gr01-1014_72]